MILTIFREHNKLDEELIEFLKQGNIVKRCAYNFFMKNVKASLSECEKYIKTLNNIDKINASCIKSLCNMMKNIDDVNENQKYINNGKLFGSRKLFNLLAKNEFKSVKEREKTFSDYKLSKNSQMLTLRGSSSDSNGNRFGKLYLDDKDSNIIHLEIRLPGKKVYKFTFDNIKRNQLDDIKIIIELIKIKKAYFNIGISGSKVYISYENSIIREKLTDLIEDRVMGIDVNPGETGCVVMQHKNIIHERIYEFNQLIKIRKADKMDMVMSTIAKSIVDIAVHYKCSKIVLEKLKFKQGSRIKMLNEWNRKDLENGIIKWCDYYGIKVIYVNSVYSSFIGQLNNPTKIDSIAAAIELGRRSYMTWSEVKEEYTTILNNNLIIDDLPNRWKDEVNRLIGLGFSFNTLLGFYSSTKKSNSMYSRVRIRLNNIIKDIVGFSLKSKKSLVYVYDIKGYHFK